MSENIIDAIAGEEETDASLEGEGVAVEAAETEEPAAPEEKAEAEEDHKSEPKMVPVGALIEERNRAKDFRDELTATRERMAKMEALFEQIQKKAAPAGPENKIPSYDEDPDGNLRGTIAQLQQRLEQFEGKAQKQEKETEAQAEERKLMDQYAASVRTFSAEKADFQDAYAYLAKSAEAELIARGYDDPKERAEILLYEEGQIVGRAMRAGKNPAEALYNYATHRGYKTNGQGDVRANGVDTEDKLGRLKKGAEASKSLSGAPSKSEGATTLERLVELADSDPKAFDREFEKARRAGMLG